jgi:hypothetical protein
LLIFVTCYCTTEILSQVILRPLSTMPDRIMPLKTKKRRWEEFHRLYMAYEG